MSLAAKLRDALPAGTELNRDGMSDATGLTGRQLSNQLYAATTRGELLDRDKNGEKFYRLNPDYQRGGNKAKADKPKKVAGKKGKRKYTRKVEKRPYRKLLKSVSGGAALRDLALDNYLAACLHLRTTVGEQVEDVDQNPALAAAITNHDRALKLHAAAGAA